MSNPSPKEEGPTHRVLYFRVDIPPDETCTVLRSFQQHSKDSRFKNLAALLEQCVVTLRDELTHKPSSLQSSAPYFDNLLALAEHPASLQGPLATAFRQALSVTVQVASVVGFYESNGITYRPAPSSTTLLGVGVGLLAAAAVSAASSLPELVELTLRAIRVAFRLGLYVNQVSSQFEPEGNALARDSWSFAISDMTVEEIQHEIDRYNAETSCIAFALKERPEFCKLYIGATLGMTTCISAPPSQLRRAFRESPVLSSSRHMPLPVFNGLYHASHIYDPSAIEDLLHDVAVGTEPTPISVVSPLTGECFMATRIGQLMVEIAVEFLTGAIHTDQVNAGAVQQLTQAAAQHCVFQILHISPFSNGLAAAIHAAIPSLSVEQEVLFDWISQEYGKRRPRTRADSKIAIVGMACRMPGGANSLDEFWQLMEEGRDVHCRVPADRFDIDAHYDPTAQLMNSTQTPYGNFIDRPGYMDAAFFHMSPREAEQTDPMHRLALVTAYEALEMSGYAPDRTPSSNRQRVGTYYGQAADDYRELNNSQNVGTYAVPAGERGFANGRINYFFKFCGPSLNIDTACSSSSAAVHTACNAIWAGEVDMALAGGLNVITDPDNFAGLCSSHFLSRTGQCKVWDRDADGYCRGDGIGCVVLKRLEDAEADNDNILGVILSAATNHSANAISITHPHAGAQIDNYRNVMQHAAVDPRHVEYVELHGTGTQAGDLEECTSIREVFAPLAPRRRADQRLRLGSIKSNIGHGEASAGIASIIKLLLRDIV
ncbi:putative polyketide synthase [Penicillium brevicompactum]